MRWPWRRRGSKGRVVFIGTSPFDVAQVIASIPTPSPAVTAFVPEPSPEPDHDPRVRLGFADGTELALEDDDPRAAALRRVAATLVGGES